MSSTAKRHPFVIICLVTALIVICTADFWTNLNNYHLTTLVIASYGLIAILLGIISLVYDELRELRRRIEELEEDECC